MSMLNIVLCDDNQQMQDAYSSLIMNVANYNGINITLSTFESGESLVFHLLDSPNQADIIYLDILMGPLNGMKTAKKLRELGCSSEIIFLTTSEDYVFEAFDISPVQYLIKDSTTAERFEQVFLRAVSLTREKKTEMFICDSGNTRKVIPIRSISYFEIWKRVIIVHYQKRDLFEYYGTLEQLEQQLLGKGVIRVHRSYMVNMPYIAKFQSQKLVLKTGEVIPIGVTYMKLVKQTFSNYLSQSNIHSFGG